MTKEDKIKLSQNLAVVSAIVVLVMSALLLLNHWQLVKSDPLENEALKTLVERSFENPEDEALREDVRNLDLMTRKAFFSAKWQTQTGSLILLFSGILLVASLRVYYSQTKQIPQPDSKKVNEGLMAIITQRWIIGIGLVLMILAFIAGLLPRSPLYDTAKIQYVDIEPQETDSNIEVIIIEDTSAIQTVADSNLLEVDSVVNEVVTETISPFPTLAEVKANFASFRGYWGNGVASFKNIPTSFDKNSNKNILWKTEIPIHGYNSPIIWGDKVFVAGGDKTMRIVYCLNRNSGSILWQKEVKNVPGSPAKQPKTTDDTGLSAASVSTDGRKVIAVFGNGDLIAFDMEGKELWSKNFGVPDNHYGHSSSLILYKDKLFMQYDSNRGGKVYAINTKDGSTKWETVRKCKISWASPIIAEIAGKKQLILASNPIVAGYDIDSGKELWAVDCMYGEVGPSPAYGSGLIFAANEYAKLVAIDPADGYKIKWEDDEYLPEVASPVVSNGLLFIATSYGALICYDALTGDKQWEKEYNNGFYSSPIVVEGKLYAIDMDGVVHIIKVDKSYKEIASPKMNEEIVTTPAFSDGRIYIRGKKYLYCIGK